MESIQNSKKIIEAVLFAAGYPLSYVKLAELLETDMKETKKIVSELAAEYDDRGIQLIMFEDSCQLCSKKQYELQVRTALEIKGNNNLSNSSLEVLSIIAYNQPTTRAFIEQVRGVDCAYAINSLMNKKLIYIKGRLDVPGKPMLYATTEDFLRCFGISSLNDLPPRDTVIDKSLDMAFAEDKNEISEESENLTNETAQNKE